MKPIVPLKHAKLWADGICPIHQTSLNMTYNTMNYLKSVVGNFLKQEDGPTAVEYAIMLALIVLVCVAAIVSVGESARGVFQAVSNGF